MEPAGIVVFYVSVSISKIAHACDCTTAASAYDWLPTHRRG